MNIKILNANTVKSTLGYKASAGCEIHAGKASAKSGIFEAFAVGPNVGAGAQADFKYTGIGTGASVHATAGLGKAGINHGWHISIP